MIDKIVRIADLHVRLYKRLDEKYFYLGYSDGDECFSYNIKNDNYHFHITSCFTQNWDFMEKLFKHMNISYGINLRDRGKSKSSYIRISNRGDLIKMGNYLYSSFIEDNIGLNRKYYKFLEIKRIHDERN